jgi:hypothetical protein
MLGLTNLDISSMGVSNLFGLETALNLETLNASANQIHDITPIAGLSNLKSLNLSHDLSIDYSMIGGLTNLSSLALNSDFLTNIDFLEKLTGLTSLSLADNAITNVTVIRAMTEIQSLDLSDNPIENVSVLSNLPALQQLMLNNTSLADIRFLTNFPNLIWLSLNQNSIADPTPLVNLQSLVSLFLEGNEITSLDFATNLAGLRCLDLQNNRITDISALEQMSPISSCNLSDNCVDISNGSAAMKTINSLSWHILCWFQHEIPTLAVPSNWTIPANRTTPIAFRASDGDVYWGWPDGMMATAEPSPSGLIAIQTLDVLGSEWQWCKWLVSITPTTNQTGTGFVSVTVADHCFSSTADIQITVEWPTNVVFADYNLEQAIRSTLHLFQGDITTADLKNVTSLQAPSSAIINLSGLQWAVNLTNLDLSGNYISDLSPLRGLTNLHSLNLAKNSLTQISVLAELPLLNTVDVSGNWLDTSAGAATWETITSLTDRNVAVACASQTTPPNAVNAIGNAVEAPNLQWVSGGDAPWFVENQDAQNGTAAAQSGIIADSQNSWLATTVTGPITLSFWWKVSSEKNYDQLQLYANGMLVDAISGQTDWQQRRLSLTAGNQELMWLYSKDQTLTEGHDAAFLDHLVFGGVETPISINAYGMTADGRFQFGIQNPQGQTLEIQSCTNLTTGIWTTIGTIANQSGQVWFVEPDGNTQERFFRVRMSGF